MGGGESRHGYSATKRRLANVDGTISPRQVGHHRINQEVPFIATFSLAGQDCLDGNWQVDRRACKKRDLGRSTTRSAISPRDRPARLLDQH